MILDIRELTETPRHIEGEEPAETFDINEDSARISDPVKYDLQAYIVSEELIISGSLKTTVTFECSKCAEFFTVKLEENAFLCTREIVEEPESVDLTGDIREAMLLTFPAYPVCDSDCRGLCPQCGVNKNNGACKCAGPEDMRWSKLDKLDIEDS